MKLDLSITIDHLWNGCRAHPGEAIELEVSRDETGDLHLHVNAPFHNDPAPEIEAGPTDALWDYEVVELFLVGQKGDFLELELGPHGHHLVLYLEKPRTISKAKLPIEYATHIDGERWSGTAHVKTQLLPKALTRFNAFAIHGVKEHRRYLAAYPLPGDRPDFHKIHAFPELPTTSPKSAAKT